MKLGERLLDYEERLSALRLAARENLRRLLAQPEMRSALLRGDYGLVVEAMVRAVRRDGVLREVVDLAKTCARRVAR